MEEMQVTVTFAQRVTVTFTFSFEKDVQAANAAGLFAVWFNPNLDETRKSDWHVTVHSMEECLEFFKSLD